MNQVLLERMIEIVRKNKQTITEFYLLSLDPSKLSNLPEDGDVENFESFFSFFEDVAATVTDDELRVIAEGYLRDGVVDYKTTNLQKRVPVPKIHIDYIKRPKMPRLAKKK